MSPKRKQISVQFDSRADNWQIKMDGRALGQFNRKEDAVRNAAERGRASEPAELTIKGKNGRIQDRRTYGSDPRRTKG